MISIGDTVTWESRASGSWKQKEGTVVAIVPPGGSALVWVLSDAKKSHIKLGVDSISKVTGPWWLFWQEKPGKLCINYYGPRLLMLKAQHEAL